MSIVNKVIQKLSTTKIMWEDKWLQVLVKDGWYTYTHNKAGTGSGVAVLVYKDSGDFLIRLEHTPCHGEGLRKTSLTGTIELGHTPEQTAIIELKEEAGIDAEESELTDLGWVYPSKFTDYRQYLFALNGSNKTLGEIKGDGTEGEKGAQVIWLPMKEALEVNDSTVSATIAKLISRGLIKTTL